MVQPNSIRTDPGMKVLIFGSTGGTGRQLVEQALGQGHVVTAFARNPLNVRLTHPNLGVAQGNALDRASVESVAHGQDAVLSTLGARVNANVWPLLVIILGCQLIARFAGLTGAPGWLVRLGVPVVAYFVLFRPTRTLSEASRNIVHAIEKAGGKRFICESSFGVGDSKGQLGFLITWLMVPILLRYVFADKEVQEQIIKDSRLDWVIVRPAALTNGPKTAPTTAPSPLVSPSEAEYRARMWRNSCWRSWPAMPICERRLAFRIE